MIWTNCLTTKIFHNLASLLQYYANVRCCFHDPFLYNPCGFRKPQQFLYKKLAIYSKYAHKVYLYQIVQLFANNNATVNLWPNENIQALEYGIENYWGCTHICYQFAYHEILGIPTGTQLAQIRKLNTIRSTDYHTVYGNLFQYRTRWCHYS